MRVERNNMSNGMGELIPGTFVVPQNPITAVTKASASVTGPSAYVPGVGMVKVMPRIGEILDAQWVVPQNPIMDAQRNRVGVGNAIIRNLGACGCGTGKNKNDCGCHGKGWAYGRGGKYPESAALAGLGELSMDSLFATLSRPVMGIPMYALLGLGFVVVNFLSNRGPQYELSKQRIRAKYGTRVRRAAATAKRLVGSE